jgi:hypothetical protein
VQDLGFGAIFDEVRVATEESCARRMHVACIKTSRFVT